MALLEVALAADALETSGHLAKPVGVVLANSPALSLIPLIPLVGALLAYLAGYVFPRRQNLSGWVATSAAFVSFGVVVDQCFQLQLSQSAALHHAVWQWIDVERLSIEFAFLFDRLTSVMALIVTGVGSLIHLYAIGYMDHDESRPRFFAYLNLFLFAMLLLVLGDSLLVMFVGWEGVGLCSYLLIGFWHKEGENAKAGQKAFVVNRIGDAGFLLGMFVLFWSLGTLQFLELESKIGGLSPQLINLAALLLFVGAVGKSAQIPLYVWLPDAMAGPTPVSALIHAATMVTSGIYMITRMEFLYVLAPQALAVIAVIGALTALFAASIALVQFDIKKVLAYSTVSQLGYMFMALGAGAFSNGIFHVVTHAFFKACLFMCAGSVIIGCHHEQDMRKFGGLLRLMPITAATYLVATFAISGFPFLSGFYSKDAILWAMYSAQEPALTRPHIFGYQLNHVLWFVGLFTAFLTAFYMTRSAILTFFGPYRGEHHPHESPLVVTIPLIILAGLSIFFGFLYGENLLHFLARWTRGDLLHPSHSAAYVTLEYVSIAVAVSGMLLAGLVFGAPLVGRLVGLREKVAQRLSWLVSAMSNKWWVDELYESLLIKPLNGISNALFKIADRMVIDGMVNSLADLTGIGAESLAMLHRGRVKEYAVIMLAGTAFLIMLGMMV